MTPLQSTESKVLFLALVVVIIFWMVSPGSNSGNIKEHKAKEALLKSEINRLNSQNKKLKSDDLVKETLYQKRDDSLTKIAEQTQKIKVVYRTVREATDQKPDSINLLNEVRESRKLIDQQDAHINAFIKLKEAGDSLIASKIRIIQNQDSTIQILSNRFVNMVAHKDQQIKKERRQKNRFKASTAFAVLVIIGQVVFSP